MSVFRVHFLVPGFIMLRLRLASRVASNIAPSLVSGQTQCLWSARSVRFYAPSGGDMKVINYLLKVESEGHKYYKELADKAPNRGFAYIFNMLARDEKKHYDAIEQLSFTGTFEMANTTIPGNTLTMFEKLRADPDVNLLAARDQVELYEQVSVSLCVACTRLRPASTMLLEG